MPRALEFEEFVFLVGKAGAEDPRPAAFYVDGGRQRSAGGGHRWRQASSHLGEERKPRHLRLVIDLSLDDVVEQIERRLSRTGERLGVLRVAVCNRSGKLHRSQEEDS